MTAPHQLNQAAGRTVSSRREARLSHHRSLVLAPEPSPTAADRWRLLVVEDRGAQRVTLGALPLRSLGDLDALQAALLSIASRVPRAEP